MSRFQRTFGVIVAISAALVGLACSVGGFSLNLGRDATATPAVAVQLPTAASTIAGPLATLAPTAIVKSTPVPQATLAAPATGLPDLSDIKIAFDALDSYRMAFVMTITGKDAQAKEVKQDLYLLQEIIRSSDSMHLGMSGTGMTASLGGGGIDIYQIGKTGFMLMGDKGQNTCLSFSSDRPTFDRGQILTPEQMMGSIQLQSLVAKGEMVNGVKADHYKVARSVLGFGRTTSESGEVWVAQEGGYLVKFTGTAEGEFTIISEAIKGSVTWTYDLTEANMLKEIVLPAECKDAAAAGSDLPIPPNATDQGNLGEIITFKSPDAPKIVGDYYRENLPLNGWEITSDTNLDTVVMLTAQKDTRKFSIMIAAGANNTGSSVVITRAQ